MLAAGLCLVAGCDPPRTITPRVVSAMNVAAAEVVPRHQFDQQLSVMRTHGVTSVRSDAPWSEIQPGPPASGRERWRWARTDSWVSAFARHGLTWEPILDYSAGWAKTCPGFCAPSSNSTYAAFAEAVAHRYGVGGTFWAQHRGISPHPVRIFEIWNEENVSTYRVTPKRYGALYAAARRAIRAVDPSATVIVGGLSDDSGSYSPRQDYPSGYVLAMFAAQPSLAGHVDGFGLHPYGASAQDVVQWTVHFRQTLDRLGEGSAPIYVTEFGWPTGTPRGEPWRAQQMSMLGGALSRSNCRIALVAPYDWLSPAVAPSADFGLVQARPGQVGLRAAGTAWLRSLRRRGPELRLCPEVGAVKAGG